MKTRTDYSALFNSLNSNNASAGIDYQGYSLIKSGSYKKLLKATYTNAELKEKASVSSANKKQQTVSTTDKTGYTKLIAESSSLADAAKTLTAEDTFASKDGVYNTDSIMSSLKDFIKGYNNTVLQASKVSSSEVKNGVDNMTSLTSAMSSSLAKVGITVGSDNKLSLNEDAFKAADMNNVKELFGTSHSYGAQIQNRAAGVSSAAVMNNALYNSNATLTNNLSGLFNTGI